MIQKKLPISLLIIAQNEESNIAHALSSVVNAFDQIIVTDGFSVDKTVDICSNFKEVEVYQNTFLGWAEQRNWTLANCGARNDYVFFLDADEYISERFVKELESLMEIKKDFSSIYVRIKYIFLGSNLKFAYGHPKTRRIFKRKGLKFTGEGAREYAHICGRSITMKNPIIHHDRKPIAGWIEKHNQNAEREAQWYFEKKKKRRSPLLDDLPANLKIKLWIRNNIWDKLPLFARPFFYFFSRYFLRLGILDGKAGLIYCYLHAFWYQSLINIKIWEHVQRKKE